MKKNRVDEILVEQTKRRRQITSYIFLIFITSIIFISLLTVYISKNKDYYVNYDENSNIDYKVYLKENDFYEKNYLDKNNQYIASLIDYIKAKFNYNLKINDPNVDYNYSYKIETVINVKEKNTNNSLYKKTETLINEKNYTSNSNKDVKITEDIEIDYNKYNDIIRKFINIYDLEETESTLSINMIVKVLGTCEDFEDTSKNESVISLTIPLTTNTIAIDINSDLIENDSNIIICKNEYKFGYLIIIIEIIILFTIILLSTLLVKYIITTRTAETIYEKELKKILNNYRSYIQKVNNQFNLSEYQVLKVDTFTDMLEIRDTIQEPILMVENKEKTGTYFIIPSKTKILYMYGIKVSEIKKKMKENDNQKV